MKIDVVTLFPKMFESPMAESMMKRAVDKIILELKTHDMRQWAWNSYGAVDDKPYGGGVGMLIRVDVIAKAITSITNDQLLITNEKNNNIDSRLRGNDIQSKPPTRRIILTSARGKRYTQEDAKRLAKYDNLIIICGHYEGFDERVSSLVDEEISIGDYVLTGGEIPAMVIIDSVTRLQAGVLGKDVSSEDESHSKEGYIEYAQYTRPAEFNGKKVPEVLLSGDPKKIEEWQGEQTRPKK
ncbi:tRNA (guanosine(37)-N1)-methyltransferase TrmD [Candidatus Shapirobacteria bacterium]|nr:tRNA (guanosine(37)-N1)-methyltransferase TrmD [Candidatus Shapirobacteria bacterium]